MDSGIAGALKLSPQSVMVLNVEMLKIKPTTTKCVVNPNRSNIYCARAVGVQRLIVGFASVVNAVVVWFKTASFGGD